MELQLDSLLISTLVGRVLPDPHVGLLNTEERSQISIA